MHAAPECSLTNSADDSKVLVFMCVLCVNMNLRNKKKKAKK